MLDRVLVVDAGHQPLVGEVQQRHARGLVDAPALRLDDAVLDLVAHAQAVAAADGVRLREERYRVLEALPVERDRLPFVEPTVTVSGAPPRPRARRRRP
jgi:hypothetical protein